MTKTWPQIPAFVGTTLILAWFIAMQPDINLPSHAPVVTSASVLDFGAKGDAKTDDSRAFAAAIKTAADKGVPLVIPRRAYVINSSLSIPSGLLIRSEGATLVHENDAVPILTADSVDDWVIDGPLTLKGTRTQLGQVGTETGLTIRNANRYIVDKLTVENFKGYGIEIVGGDSTAGIRGDQGRFAFVSLRDNRVGLRIQNGVSSEYNLFTLLSFSGNETAADIGAGNTIVSTSNIVDNGSGLLLSGGVNAGHGIVSASNINHNDGFNVKATNIEHGFTFSGCHIYGDSEAKGIINLNDSRGLHFTGGTLSAAVIQEGGGINAAVDNFMPGSHVRVTGSSSQSFIRGFHFDAARFVTGPCQPSSGQLIQPQCAR